MMKTYLHIPKIKIHNANAMSSPYTIGFPAMTAWLGMVHALQRELPSEIIFNGVAVSCHEFELMAQNGNIFLTANPMRKKGREFERPPFIPEARCNLQVSLLLETDGVNADNEEKILAFIQKRLHRMKAASGDILGFGKLAVIYLDDEAENYLTDMAKLKRKLMPGYALRERKDLLQEAAGQGDVLNNILDYLKLYCQAETDENGKAKWNYIKKAAGWLVPLAIGYKRISKLTKVNGQRDKDTPHCFVESVLTLGEFIMPYRIEDINEIMWHYEVDEEKGMYLCINNIETEEK